MGAPGQLQFLPGLCKFLVFHYHRDWLYRSQCRSESLGPFLFSLLSLCRSALGEWSSGTWLSYRQDRTSYFSWWSGFDFSDSCSRKEFLYGSDSLPRRFQTLLCRSVWVDNQYPRRWQSLWCRRGVGKTGRLWRSAFKCCPLIVFHCHHFYARRGRHWLQLPFDDFR